MATEGHKNLSIGFDAEISRFNQNIQRMNHSLTQLNTRLKQMGTASQETKKSAVIFNQYGKEIKKTNNTAKNFEQTQSKVNKKINQHGKETKKANTETVNWLSSYTESLSIAIRSTLLWAGATTAIYGTKKAIQEMHRVVVEINSEMVALERVMDSVITDFGEMEKSLASLGVEYATNVNQVVESAVQWGRQGKNQVEVLQLTEAALLASNVAQMEAVQAVDLLTSAILQFNMEAAEATEIVDRLNEVANNYAVTATNLAMAIRETGAAAYNANVSMDELLGMTTALSAATAKTGNRIGRILRTVLSRMMGDMQDAGESLGQVESMLNAVGIAVRATEDEYRNMTDVLTDLAVRWDDLDQVMQANIARAMGGRRMYSDVISLIGNWDMALESTESSLNSLGSAIRENEIYMESMEAQWTSARAQFESLALTINEFAMESLSNKMANALKSTYQNIENFLVGLNEMSKILNRLEQDYKILTAVLTSFTIFLTTKYLPAIKAATIATAKWIALNPKIAIPVAVITSFSVFTSKLGEITKEQEKLNKEKEMFNQLIEEGNKLSLEEINNVSNIIKEYKELLTQYKSIEYQLKEINESVLSFVVLTQESLVQSIYKYLMPVYKETQELFDEQKEIIDILIKRFPELAKQYNNLGTNLEQTKLFLNDIALDLRNYNDIMENTVSWISKYTVQQYESTKHGVRENQMLQSKIKRYQELEKQVNHTLAEEIELRDLGLELAREWPELVVADDFGKALEELSERKMKKFGESGTEVISTIEEMELRLESLTVAEEFLSKEKIKLANETERLRKELEKVDPEIQALKWNQLNDELHEASLEYFNIIERIERTHQTTQTLKNAIIELGGSLDDLDAGEFLSTILEISAIFENFRQEIYNIETALLDLDRTLETKLNFSNLEAELRGFTETERLESMANVFKSMQDEALKLSEELLEISASLDSIATEREIEGILNQVVGMEGIDVEPELIQRLIDDQEIDNVKDFINSLIDEFGQEFKKFALELEKIDYAINLEKIFELRNKDLFELTKEELKEYKELIIKTFEKERPIDLSELIDWEDENWFYNVVKAINNLEPFESMKIFGGFDWWETFKEALDIKQQLPPLERLYDIILGFADLDWWDEPLLSDDEVERTKQIEKHLINFTENIIKSEEELKKLFNEEDINTFQNYIDEIETLPLILKRISEEEDISETIIQELKETFNIGIEEAKKYFDYLIERSDEIELLDFIEREELALMEDYERQIFNIEKRIEKVNEKINELDEDDQLRKRLKIIKEELEDEVIDIKLEIEYDPIINELQLIDRELSRILGRERWDTPVLGEDLEKNTKTLIDSIAAFGQTTDELISDFFDKIFTADNINKLEEYTNKFRILPLELEYLQSITDEDIFDTLNIDLDKLAELAENSKKDLRELRIELENIQMADEVFSASLRFMEELPRQIAETQRELIYWQDIINDEDRNLSEEVRKEIKELIKNINNELDDFKRQEEIINIFEDIIPDSDKLIKKLEDFDLNEIIGTTNANEELEKFNSLLVDVETRISQMHDKGLDEEEITSILTDEGLAIELIENIINQLEEKQSDIRERWSNAILNGTSIAFRKFDDWDEFTDNLSEALRSVINDIVNDEDLIENLKESIETALEVTNLGHFSDEITEALIQGFEAFSQDADVLETLGTIIGSFFGAPGIMIGRTLGRIGDMVADQFFGASEEMKEAVEEAKQLNNEIINIEDRLSRFSVDIDIGQIDIDESAWWKFWSDDEVDKLALERLKEEFEEIEEVLNRLETTSDTIMSGFISAIKNSVDYYDIRRHFEQSVGQAIQDAIVSKLKETLGIKQQIDELSNMIKHHMDEMGRISESGWLRISESIQEITSPEHLDVFFDNLNRVARELGLDFEFGDTRQTYQAGSTTSLTINNTFAVNSQLFMGDEEQAYQAARLLRPYLKEVMEQYAGN